MSGKPPKEPRNPRSVDEEHLREFAASGEYLSSLYRRPEYLDYLEKATVAIKTVRLVVYAGMASFILLAIYGFYLIYQLTTDLHRAVDQAALMTQQMQSITRIMTNMDASVARLDGTVTELHGTIKDMNGHVIQLTSYMNQLGNTVALMQHSASNLDRSIGPVMGTFNRMAPLNWLGNSYQGAPPLAPPMQP
jgi:hypothetical protein